MKTLIRQATIVNEGERFVGSLLIDDAFIAQVSKQDISDTHVDQVIDAEGALLLPGVIDEHVHMREPGMTHKANMESETRAAVAGGVTSVMDMPNVVPQTTTNKLLQERYAMAEGRCHANYAFFLGATNDNLEEVKNVDLRTTPGIKVFMGSSTGNMLVDKQERLLELFAKSPLLLMTHCEDTARINANTAVITECYGKEADIQYHPVIRDAKACFDSTKLAIEMARETSARLHVAHITTKEELALFAANDPRITAEVCIPHLLYTDADYARLGARIKCNPAVKAAADREALRQALNDGRIRTVATDHAPHLLSEKQGGCLQAMSGMPMVQFSLPSMLSLTDEGILSVERMVELMCHAPAALYNVENRGFLREGYFADLALVKREAWTLEKSCIQSLCGWSPLEGTSMNWRVTQTWVNGSLAWDEQHVGSTPQGKSLKFAR